jgi:uncharacterized protein
VTSEYFLDASFAIALSSLRDQYHARALELSKRLESESARLITTRAVLLEIGNALAKQRFRASGIALLDALEQDATVEIVPVADQLYEAAVALYKKHSDKEWGLTDCMSFIVMQRHRLTKALTADEHFRQAGFQPLLVGR